MSPTDRGASKRSWVFHAVNVTLKAIWLITPLSVGVLGHLLYSMIHYRSVTPLPMIAALLCTVELISAVYQRDRIWQARGYTSICVLTADDREKFGHDIFHADQREMTRLKAGLEVTVVTDDGSLDGGETTGKLSIKARKSGASRSSTCCAEVVLEQADGPEKAVADAFRHKYSASFHHAAWNELCRTDVLTWLSASMLNIPLELALQDPGKRAYLCKMFLIIEARSGMRFPPGRNPLVKVMRVSLDPLNAAPRPLFIYAVPSSVNFVIRNAFLRMRGMHVYREGDMEYMLKIPQGWTPEAGRSDPIAMPMMYLHGMGLGLVQNIDIIKPMLDKFETHPILFPLAHHTAQSLFHPDHLRPWTRKQFVRDIQAICGRWGFVVEKPSLGEKRDTTLGGLSVMSHSNGSVHHGWLLKDCPQLIRRNTFVDPIIFCLDEGFTCHAFCYRRPTTPFQLIMQKLVSSELGISNYIQRHFHWQDNHVYIDDHPQLLDPAATHFFLGGVDDIIDAPRVRQHFEAHSVVAGLNLTWDEEGGHGKALRGASLVKVLDFMSAPPSLVPGSISSLR